LQKAIYFAAHIAAAKSQNRLDTKYAVMVNFWCWCRARRGIFSVWLRQGWKNNNTRSWCSSAFSGIESDWGRIKGDDQWCQLWL